LRARKEGGFALRLDVEVGDEDEANETIAAAADVVMLDNIESSEFASVACRLRVLSPGGKEVSARDERSHYRK